MDIACTTIQRKQFLYTEYDGSFFYSCEIVFFLWSFILSLTNKAMIRIMMYEPSE